MKSPTHGGKIIILFATSGGSGFGKAAENLKGIVSKSIVIEEGKLLNGGWTTDTLKQWASAFLSE